MIDLNDKYNPVKGTARENEFIDEFLLFQGGGLESDRLLSSFYLKRIDEYSPDDNTGYIFNAISYALLSKDKKGSEKYLRLIVDNSVKYKYIGTHLGAAAVTLGGLAEYSDPSLSHALEVNNIGNDFDIENYSHFINRVHGAYIATATDFEYGLKSAQEMDKTRKNPTLEAAEKRISAYSK